MPKVCCKRIPVLVSGQNGFQVYPFLHDVCLHGTPLHTTTLGLLYPLGYLDCPRVRWVHHHCVLTGQVDYKVRVVVTENGNGDHQHTCGYGIETLLHTANVYKIPDKGVGCATE